MKTNIFSALSEKSFLYLWIAEIFTQVPTHLFNFFLILIVYKLTQSNTAVSGIVLTISLPAVIFGYIAGVYVDRWSKKKVLISTNLLRAILLLFLTFYLNNLFVIFLISFIISTLVQFFIPAEVPIIPLVVEKKNLLSANALFGIVIFGSILIAYVLSGPLLLALKQVKTLIILALMLLIGAVFISFIKLAHSTNKVSNEDEKSLNLIRDIKHTLSLISKTSDISHSLFLLSMSQVLMLTVATLAPGFAKQILGIQIEEFSLLFIAPAALGMLIGGVVLVNFFQRRPKEKIITTGIFLAGSAMLALPFCSKIASRDFVQTVNMFLPAYLSINIFHILIFLAFLLGVANSLVFVPANTMLQEKTTEEIRGKMYGFLNTLVGAFSFFPVIVAGSLSDLFGVGAVISGIGIIILILGFIRVFID